MAARDPLRTGVGLELEKGARVEVWALSPRQSRKSSGSDGGLGGGRSGRLETVSCHQVRHGPGEIPFTLVRSRRRKKSMQVSVGLDLAVTVRAPVAYPLKEILDVVARRGDWIVRQVERARQVRPGPRRYVDGEAYPYLGRSVRLRVVPMERGEREGVRLVGDELEVRLRDTAAKDAGVRDAGVAPTEVADADGDGAEHRVERLVERWFEAQARAVVLERLEVCRVALAHLGLPALNEVKFRRMKKRWGTCWKRTGRLQFNLALGHVPVECIDFVVTHELCHLKVPNHSRAFYALLAEVMPDWKQRKEALERAPR